MSREICQVTILHPDRIEKARSGLPPDPVLAEMADIYKLLGDPTRLRLVQALAATEMCVCDLAALLETTSSAISHQLRLLRAAGLVCYRREGKMAFYRLDDGHLQALLAEGRHYVGQKSRGK